MIHKEQTPFKVLFIAKNIPVPGIRPSRIVMAIAHEISSFCTVNFLYPSEIIPFGFQLLNKYKPFYKLKAWSCEGFDISVTQYIRIPFPEIAYLFWKGLSKKDIAYYKQIGPFDLIHAHYLIPDGYLAFLYSEKFHIPYIITIRNADIRYLKRISKNSPDFKKAKTIINNASYILSLNIAYKKYIDDTFRIDSVIIPHGIEKIAFTSTYNEHNKKIIITTVSEFIKRKNIDWIVTAFRSYTGAHKIKLNIVGTGPLAKSLKELAGNDDRIQFIGKIDREEVLKYLQKSDIFVLPSFDESFGLVYLEAAAKKNAIIGMKNEGVCGIFDKGTEILFCENRLHFQEIMHKLIEDESLRVKLKEGAFSKVKTLSWENITKQYEKVYKNSIESFNTEYLNQISIHKRSKHNG